MDQNPWWQPKEADLGWDESLPDVITLAPDYGAELPLWGNGFGNIAWQYTKFSRGLLDRSLPGSRNSMRTATGTEAGTRMRSGTDGLARPRTWPRTYAASYAHEPGSS
jgi:hypothetical protein